MIAVVEKLLSERFEGKVRLEAAEEVRSVGRSKVSRYPVLEGPQCAPKSVIIKQAVAVGREVYNPETPDGPAWRLFNEWAGLRFLTESSGGASPTPVFYAGDRDHGLLALEDLGVSNGLDRALLGADPAYAEAMLVAFAATVGRMHALTIGKQAEFERIRGGLGPRRSNPPDDGGKRLAKLLSDMAQVVGVETTWGIAEELRGVTRNLVEPGPFLAYLHHDPCPDNCLITDDGLKLIDFEFGGYGHALGDGIYGRIHFPTCWCVNRLPQHIPPKMEDAYRAELVKGCPEAVDDERFYRATVEACAACIINSHNAMTLQADHRWGISTTRQRALLRFDIFWKMTENYGHLKAVGATIHSIANKLRAQWPAEADAMPYYPAFRIPV
ncbi:MAG: phosphotransferase [Chloracidobacterium sp.]|nr:phosphotransferase [Chloracidobacterium sp.]